jgi:hypothetical protein
MRYRKSFGASICAALALLLGVLIHSLDSTTAASQPPEPTREPVPTSVSFTVAGDFDMTAEAAATLAGVAVSGADFHVALGDLSYSRTVPEAAWCDWVRSQIGDVPVQLVAGNHEADYGGDGHILAFADCLPDRMESVGRYPQQYLFDVGDLARLIFISPDLTIAGEHYYYGAGTGHYQWVADAIDGARADGIRWVIVGMHKSCLSVGVYYCNVYEDLLNLLVDRRVDLVLHAHDRTYQRGRQLAHGEQCPWVEVDMVVPACIAGDGADGEYVKGQGMVFAVAGSGGTELYDVDPEDPEAGYIAVWMGANASPRHGFLQVSLSASELRGEFVGTTPTSLFTDSFCIVAPD